MAHVAIVAASLTVLGRIGAPQKGGESGGHREEETTLSFFTMTNDQRFTPQEKPPQARRVVSQSHCVFTVP